MMANLKEICQNQSKTIQRLERENKYLQEKVEKLEKEKEKGKLGKQQHPDQGSGRSAGSVSSGILGSSGYGTGFGCSGRPGGSVSSGILGSSGYGTGFGSSSKNVFISLQSLKQGPDRGRCRLDTRYLEWRNPSLGQQTSKANSATRSTEEATLSKHPDPPWREQEEQHCCEFQRKPHFPSLQDGQNLYDLESNQHISGSLDSLNLSVVQRSQQVYDPSGRDHRSDSSALLISNSTDHTSIQSESDLFGPEPTRTDVPVACSDLSAEVHLPVNIPDVPANAVSEAIQEEGERFPVQEENDEENIEEDIDLHVAAPLLCSLNLSRDLGVDLRY